jgi:hypothetical protein
VETTTIKTDLARTITVEKCYGRQYLIVSDTDSDRTISSSLTSEEAETLGESLLEAAGKELVDIDPTYTTNLPQTKRDGCLIVAGDYDRGVNFNRDNLLEYIKALIAIHKFGVNKDKEDEAARIKAQAEADAKRAKAILTARRDNLVEELGPHGGQYKFASELSQKAIDRIIALEDAAKS